MRQALRQNTNRIDRASSKSHPAPVGGWNARDALADMAADEAVILDNWFPENSEVRLRGGNTSFADGIGAGVDSLLPYTGLTADSLFAAGDGEIHDITSGGTVSTADISSLTNDRWQYTNFGNSGGNYLYIVNGEDAPRHYDGSSWATPAITGVDESTFINIHAAKERLWFIPVDDLSVWYLPVNAIAGAVTEFPFDSLCTKGGYLMAQESWSRDGGDGVDDFSVFITSQGEVLLYQGIDPSSASTWALVGIYQIGKPIGRRCFLKQGSELIIITEDGFIPMLSIVQHGRKAKTGAISDKIRKAVNASSQLYKSNYGWQAVYFSTANMAIFNIPVGEGSGQHQYVMNTDTKAWCRFTGLEANCWTVHDDKLYFGAEDGGVYQAENGTADNDANIATYALTAYSYFENRSGLKHFTMARPNLSATGALAASVSVSVNFQENEPATAESAIDEAGATWDDCEWDVCYWGDTLRVLDRWHDIAGEGYTAALGLKTNTKLIGITWIATDWIYESGRGLV